MYIGLPPAMLALFNDYLLLLLFPTKLIELFILKVCKMVSQSTKCDWIQYKERYLDLSLSVFDSVKSTIKPDKFSIYMQKYRLIEHFFVIEND